MTDCYRFSIRTYAKNSTGSGLAIDIAVRLPPESFEPFLGHHRFDGAGNAIAVVDTATAAKAAHDELINLVRIIDATELKIEADQSAVRSNAAFYKPIALVDDAGSIAVLDRQKPKQRKSRLSAAGWSTETLCEFGFSDGTAPRISSQELDVAELVERILFNLT